MRALALCGAASMLVMGGPVRAESELSLTIYNSNLALVEDVRPIEVDAGRTRLEFKDVSAQIRPETVALNAPGVTILEQNFDYDLLTPDKLMEKAVGGQVQIVRTNPGNGQQQAETATVLAANQGVVLKIGERIEVLRDDGAPTRVIFDKVPENLRARPTLSVTVDSERPGPRQARLSYLTSGLSWRADYVAMFDEKAGKVDLQGWITLSNTSGTGFANARTLLVAGDVSRSSAYGRRGGPVSRRTPGTETGAADSLGDYYLYSLPERTTLAQNQTKQVGFLDADGVAARKGYEFLVTGFQSAETASSADVMLRFANTASAGLNKPLPAGTVRVYVRDRAGAPQFIGEDALGHTPAGSELAIRTGAAFDVTVQPTLVATQKLSDRAARYTMTYAVRNARPDAVTVDLRQGGLWRFSKVVDESLKGRRVDAHSVSWTVAVPANGETVLRAVFDQTW